MKYLTAIILCVLCVLNFTNSSNRAFAQNAGATYYVSTTGSDTNTGSQAAPFKTFAKAITQAASGDTIIIRGGTYTERLVITKSGQSGNPITIKAAAGEKVIIDGANSRQDLILVASGRSYISFDGIEVKNSSGQGVTISGSNIILSNIIAHHTQAHGIYFDGQHIIIRNSTVYMSNLVNSIRSGVQWGSGFKCRVGGDDILFEYNTSYNNYGEGIAFTRCSNVVARNNIAYDNFSVNLYLDNSHDVTFDKNLVYCTVNSGFEKDGNPPAGIAIGEEYYDGWGAQLARAKITNNIVSSCKGGVVVWNSDVDGGLDTALIANNTFWNSTGTALSVAYTTAKDKNIRIMNNIIQQSSGKLAWVENRSTVTLSHNFWMPSAPSGAGGAGDKTGNVLFAQTPSTTASSFRLSQSSPAINSGIALTDVADDYEGKMRSNPPDMGALEFESGSVIIPTPTPTPSAGHDENPTPSPTVASRASITPTITPGTAQLPNPPSWWWTIPDTLRNFLEQLYMLVYYFGRSSNLQYLLEGVVTTTPTPEQ